MAAYATVTDVTDRMVRELSEKEQTVVGNLLDDAAVLIDAYNVNASSDAKKIVSCRMVIRAIGDGSSEIPAGATQGTISALGYSQTWTMGTNASVGQLYLDRTDKAMLGGGSKIGSYSPVEELARTEA
jgi:hypothetical protein